MVIVGKLGKAMALALMMICACDVPGPSHLRISQTVIRKSGMHGCPDCSRGVMIILECKLSRKLSPRFSKITARARLLGNGKGWEKEAGKKSA